MFCIYEYDSIAKLDSMCWFSHRHSRAREDCSQQNRTQAAVNVHCRHPVTPWRPHNGLVCCCVQCTTYSARIALPCNVSGDDSAFFGFFCAWWPWPLTLTFELGRDFCTMHLTAKFHHPTLNRSEVIMRTNKQTDAAENITSLRCATPVGNE